jgi:Fe-S-cluster containining protein
MPAPVRDTPAVPPAGPTVLPVAAARKPWFHDGIQFGCTRCGACCRSKGYLWLSAPDIARMADHLGMSIDEFRARHTREITVEGQEQPGICVVRAPHGCSFLDDATNECTIHPARPTQCRTFPFWPMLLESREAWQREVGGLCGREALEQGPIYGVDEILAMSSHIVAVAPVPPEAGREPV